MTIPSYRFTKTAMYELMKYILLTDLTVAIQSVGNEIKDKGSKTDDKNSQETCNLLTCVKKSY